MSIADAVICDLMEDIIKFDEKVVTRNSSVLRRCTPYTHTFISTPLVNIRKTAWKTAIKEMEWFLSGSSYLEDADKSVHKWWKPWTNTNGEVPNNYSKQFRHYGSGFDQIDALVEGIRTHPFSRRNIITTWHSEEMASKETPITNCHNTITQAFVDKDKQLHLTTYQRSCDIVLGMPHNWIQMWAFLHWLAHVTSTKVGSLSWIGGDMHIYDQHIPMAVEMINTCEPKSSPELVYTPTSDKFLASDFSLSEEYNPVICEPLEMVV